MIRLDKENSVDWCDNDLGIFTVFYTNCYGIRIFLCVGEEEIDGNMVWLYELKTVKYKAKDGTTGVALSYDKRTHLFRAKDRFECLIAPKNKSNCCTNAPIKAYIVKNKKGEFIIPFEVEIGSELYKKIKEQGIYKDYKMNSLKLVFKLCGRHKDYQRLKTAFWADDVQEQRQIVMNVSEKVYDA